MRKALIGLMFLSIGCTPTNGPAASGLDGTVQPQGEPKVTHMDRSAFKPGEKVTVFGQAFDPVAANNKVEFVGAETAPSLATRESMLVTVPLEARSGALRVFVRGQAVGLLSYVVDAPEIATISHAAASAGNQLTLRGRNFAPVLSENRVSFNGTEVLPLAGGNGLLLVSVTGTSGPLTVRTGAGTSAPVDFVVVPQLGGNFNP